jgi:hypothetical protein
MAGRQQTAPPQKRRSKDATAHPHQPGAHPDPPHPDRAHSRRHHPGKATVKFPLRNRIFSLYRVVCSDANVFSKHCFPSPVSLARLNGLGGWAVLLSHVTPTCPCRMQHRAFRVRTRVRACSASPVKHTHTHTHTHHMCMCVDRLTGAPAHTHRHTLAALLLLDSLSPPYPAITYDLSVTQAQYSKYSLSLGAHRQITELCACVSAKRKVCPRGMGMGRKSCSCDCVCVCVCTRARPHPHPTSIQHSCNVQACRAS